MADTIEKDALKVTKELLKKLDVSSKIEIERPEEGVLKVVISGDDLGRLIGYRGRTLESLQLVLSLMVNQQRKDQDWVRVLVDIGGWRQSREESLKEMAERAVKKVKEYHEAVALPPMGATDRRIIHMLLQDQDDISSDSEGEGAERRVVVKLKR